jgi:hypothetical protein
MQSTINCMASCLVIPKFLDYQAFRMGSALLQTLLWSICLAHKQTPITQKQALLLGAILDRLSEVPLEHLDKLTIVTDPDPRLFLFCAVHKIR